MVTYLIGKDVFRLSGTFFAVENKYGVAESTGEVIERTQTTDKVSTA